MKTTWNYSRRLLPFFLCMLLSVFGNNAQTLPFRLSKGAGTFRLGVVCGNESCWLDQCSVKKKGQAYTIKDKLWKEGEIKLIVCPLTNSMVLSWRFRVSDYPKSSNFAGLSVHATVQTTLP